MDMKMPVMDGAEATLELKSGLNTKGVPIISLSASMDDESIRAREEAGCDAQLAKPIQSRELFAVLARFLSEKT
jgi:CheY-like chemotaxis protein